MGKPTRLFDLSQYFTTHTNLAFLTAAVRSHILSAVPMPCGECDKDAWLRAQDARMTIDADLDNLENILFARAVLSLADSEAG